MRGFGFLLVAVLFLAAPAHAESVPDVPAKGTVTMVDLGAKSCIPCKMMIPVLEAVEKDYAGRASIVFIDIRQTPDMGRQYGVRVIPTQIFYDRHGKEAFRHEGFFDKDAIAEVLDNLLKQ